MMLMAPLLAPVPIPTTASGPTKTMCEYTQTKTLQNFVQ